MSVFRCFWLLIGLSMLTSMGAELPRGFLVDYCLKCHEGDEAEAGVRLSESDLAGTFAEHRKLWAEVLVQLEDEEMPTKAPFPTADERELAIEWIRASIDAVDFEALRKESPPVTARLTELQYRNALRDLFGMRLHLEPGRNDREDLSISPATMESYFGWAERAVDAWLGPVTPLTVTVEAEKMPRSVAAVKDFRDGVVLVQPGHEVSLTVEFPVDGRYEFRLRGAAFENRVEAQFWLDAEPVARIPMASSQWSKADWVTTTVFVERGSYTVRLSSANLVPQTPLPPGVQERVMAAAREKAPRFDLLSAKALNAKSVSVQEAYEWLRVLGPEGDPREIDRFRNYALERLKSAEPLLSSLIEEAGLDPVETHQEWRKNREDRTRLLSEVSDVAWTDWMRYQGRLFADQIEVRGPILEVPRMVPPGPGSLAELVPRAFRREVSPSEIAKYEAIFDDSGLRAAVIALLVSPEFLLRGGEEETEAARRSFFLWQSIPDPAVGTSVDAMLEDPRSISFYRAFAEDWLGIANLGTSVTPDRDRFPEFTEDTAVAYREAAVERLAEAFLKNESLLELIEGERALQELPAVLTVTSSPGRTNPVRRGTWILERLLGDPPGEALPSAGELAGDAGADGPESLREELERHRRDPACARCHDKIDPLGFALQEFDAIGRPREARDWSGLPIRGATALKEVLSGRREEFVRELTRRMMSFAMGRELTIHDEAMVREIAAEVAAHGYEARELVRAVVVRL